MRTLYIADDGTKFDTEEECIEYEKVTIPVYYAVDVFKPRNGMRNTEQLIGIYFSREKAGERIDEIRTMRNNNDDMNQSYEIRTTKMTKEFYGS